jgi:hypothetical protein
MGIFYSLEWVIKGGAEDIYKIKIELGREWQVSANAF